MQASRILPDLQCSLVCEDVRREANGKFILIGVINYSLVQQLPVGARLSVRCIGASCPFHSEMITARAPPGRTASTTVLVRLVRLERSLPAGTRIEIGITKANRVGKFTSLTIRRGTAPLRTDKCLFPGTPRPRRCP